MEVDARVEVMICLAQSDGRRGMKIDNNEILKLTGKISQARLFINPRANFGVEDAVAGLRKSTLRCIRRSCQGIEALTLMIFHLVCIQTLSRLL